MFTLHSSSRSLPQRYEYSTKLGYSRITSIAIFGTAPVQGHISGVVDIPMHLPLFCCSQPRYFDFDIRFQYRGADQHVQSGKDIRNVT